MKSICIGLVLLCNVAFAQVNHYVAAGCYGNYSTLTNIAETPYVRPSYSGRLNASPFAEYTVAFDRVNASLGVAAWHTGAKAKSDFSLPPFLSVSVENESREHYLTFPLGVGYDVVHGDAFAAGVKGKAVLRYLYHSHAESKTRVASLLGDSTANVVTDVYWDDLDTVGVNRLIFSPGGSLYAGYSMGRFMPFLEAGVLFDTIGLVEGQSDQNKYLQWFAALSIRFRLNGDKPKEQTEPR